MKKKIKQKIKKILGIFTKHNIQYLISKRNESYKNIIFYLPAANYPSGGVIVAHDHSDAINKLEDSVVRSMVMYPSDINFSPNLFAHNSIFKRDFIFDVEKDFVILPEVMVLRYAADLYKNNIKYGIHVQNGYLMDLELRSNHGSFSQLKDAYQNASLIIGNSTDTIDNIKYVFPECSEKVIRSYFVINKHKYQPIRDKKNIITYMPRKLAKHSQHVLFFLNEKIPDNWKIVPIDGVTEQEVYDIFYESKIFLSFSEFEGLAMPPAMAAMSGNRVIGYTGEANKEYFYLPCFEEVPCGDVKLFSNKVLCNIKRFDNNEVMLDLESIGSLEDLFSKTKQTSFLEKLVSIVKNELMRL